MAGDFDTFKIVCKRYYVSMNKNKSNLREVKTWNYAPQVGHYVLATTKYYYDKKPRRQELLAVLPPLNGPFCRSAPSNGAQFSTSPGAQEKRPIRPLVE